MDPAILQSVGRQFVEMSIRMEGALNALSQANDQLQKLAAENKDLREKLTELTKEEGKGNPKKGKKEA